MGQEKMCYIIFFTLTSILLDDVFTAESDPFGGIGRFNGRDDVNLDCGTPSGKAPISTTCCADTARDRRSNLCVTLSNKNGKLNVTGKSQSAGVIFQSVIDSNSLICGDTKGGEACIDVLSRNATLICFKLSVQDNTTTSKTGTACLNLPSLKLQSYKISDFFNGFNRVFSKIGGSKQDSAEN